MATITVNNGESISAAIAASQPGDTIQVQAGTYTNDFPHITHSLTLQAVGGFANLVATVSPPDGKAILTEGAPGIDVRIDGFSFSGAAVADGNGAGLRYEGGDLTITNSHFFNNEDGLLGGADPNGHISISTSEFDHNGTNGTGQTHNIYIGDIASFTLTNSFSHDANVGHEIKSRAVVNTITNNRIFDNSASASYSIDLPWGGTATISGNVIEQGPNSQNSNIISYGEEGLIRPSNSLTVSGNTFENDKGAGPAVTLASGSPAVTFSGNSVWGFSGALVSGPSNESGTIVLSSRPALDQSPPETGPACFCEGTMIETTKGARRVETLSIGDRLITDAGEVKSIIWIGRRVVFCAGHRDPRTVWPVRIAAGAFEAGGPRRDLWLSPDHAILMAGVLVPVRLLINGHTIAQYARASVTYYHIELVDHDVILAEGLAVESYLNIGARDEFADDDDDEDDDEPVLSDLSSRRSWNVANIWEARGAAPLVLHGKALEALRALVPGYQRT